MVKVHFDVEKSLKECDPEEYYSQKGIDGKPLFPGVKFKKRFLSYLIMVMDIYQIKYHKQ